MEQYISLILNAILGGGFLVTLVTMRSTKKKAIAEAKANELDNVQEAITIWREMAEGLKHELESSRANYTEVAKQVESLKRAVTRLTTINNRIVSLLDKITPENLDDMVEKIKKLHNEN